MNKRVIVQNWDGHLTASQCRRKEEYRATLGVLSRWLHSRVDVDLPKSHYSRERLLVGSTEQNSTLWYCLYNHLLNHAHAESIPRLILWEQEEYEELMDELDFVRETMTCHPAHSTIIGGSAFDALLEAGDYCYVRVLRLATSRNAKGHLVGPAVIRMYWIQAYSAIHAFLKTLVEDIMKAYPLDNQERILLQEVVSDPYALRMMVLSLNVAKINMKPEKKADRTAILASAIYNHRTEISNTI